MKVQWATGKISFTKLAGTNAPFILAECLVLWLRKIMSCLKRISIESTNIVLYFKEIMFLTRITSLPSFKIWAHLHIVLDRLVSEFYSCHSQHKLSVECALSPLGPGVIRKLGKLSQPMHVAYHSKALEFLSWSRMLLGLGLDLHGCGSS